MTVTFKQLEYEEVKFPQQVRCANCGQMADYEDFDTSPGDWVLTSYICVHCSWWTEWEITHDGANGLQSSTLYYRHTDDDLEIQWYEARDWPGYWRPNGFEIPEEAKHPKLPLEETG